jgi:hypothetical protein
LLSTNTPSGELFQSPGGWNRASREDHPGAQCVTLKSIKGVFENTAISLLTSGFLASLNAVIVKIS